MIVFIIGLLLLIVGITLMVKFNLECSCWDTVGFILTLLGAVTTITIIVVLGTKRVANNTFDDRYNKVKREIIVFQNSSADVDYEYTTYLTNEMKDINECIEKHNYFHTNPFVDLFYSKEIGEHQPFDIKQSLQKK